MRNLRIKSAVEQVAEHVTKGLMAGVWRGEMPGVVALASELGINHKTADAALSLLERQGVLMGQGRRRPRLIPRLEKAAARRSLRIGMLLHNATDLHSDLTGEIRHQLHEAGHASFVAKRLLTDFGTDVSKVAALVQQQAADAWLVKSAPFEVLEWFVESGIPVFSLFGRFRKLPVAGGAPDKTEAYSEAVRTLVRHGHRRIVLLARSQHRHPVPSQTLETFLASLAAEGIKASEYHCPFWENTREGFQRCLESLFQVSPPTALVVQETLLFGAVQQFVEARGIRVPKDLSLLCTDPDPSFLWRIPTVAHIRWEGAPIVRRVRRWAENVALGKDDRRQLLTKAEFVRGGTIARMEERDQ